jgi:protein-tyrosine phosphatase
MDFETLSADLETEPIAGYIPTYGQYVRIPLVSHITDNLYVGGHSDFADLGDFFTHIFSFYVWGREYKNSGSEYREFKMYDGHDGVDQDTLSEAVPAIVSALENGGNVLVHCQAGINRSNLAAALVLREWKGLTSAEAIDMLREKRGQVVLANSTFERYLRSLDD